MDAPAGYGHLAMHLKNMGYQVVCGEMEPDIFRVKDINRYRTDLTLKKDIILGGNELIFITRREGKS